MPERSERLGRAHLLAERDRERRLAHDLDETRVCLLQVAVHRRGEQLGWNRHVGGRTRLALDHLRLERLCRRFNDRDVVAVGIERAERIFHITDHCRARLDEAMRDDEVGGGGSEVGP